MLCDKILMNSSSEFSRDTLSLPNPGILLNIYLGIPSQQNVYSNALY